MRLGKILELSPHVSCYLDVGRSSPALPKKNWLPSVVNHGLGKTKQFGWRFAGMIDINAKNNDGETAFMLAKEHQQFNVVKIFTQFNADTTQLRDIVFKAIHSNVNDTEKQLQAEQHLALFMEKNADMVMTMIDEQGQNVLHQCVLNFQDRIAKILLHGLNENQRQTLCQMKDKNGLSAIDFCRLLNKNDKINSFQKEMLHKIERALIFYDPTQFEKKSLLEKSKFQYALNNDLQSEIMKTNLYRNLSRLLLAHKPLYFLINQLMISGNLWLGLEAALEEFLNGDVIDKIERLLNTTPCPDQLKVPVSSLQTIFSFISLYRNTSQRIIMFGVRHTIVTLFSTVRSEKNIYDKNYFKYLNNLTVIYFLSEEALGKHLAPYYLSNYSFSLENCLNKQFGIPTLSSMLNHAGEKTNHLIKQWGGINLKRNIKRGYYWARENIGNIPFEFKTPQDFYDKMDLPSLDTLPFKEKAGKNLFQLGLDELFNEYQYESAELKFKIFHFYSYAQSGYLNSETASVIHEAAILLSQKNYVYGECLATLFMNHPLFSNEFFDEKILGSIQEAVKEKASQLKNEINSDEMNQLLSNHLENAKNIYAVESVKKGFMPLVTLTDPALQSSFEQFAQTYVKTHSDDENLVYVLQDLILLSNTGKLTPQAYNVLKVLEPNKEKLVDFITKTITSNELYKVLSEEKFNEFKQKILNTLSNDSDLSESICDNLSIINKQANIYYATTYTEQVLIPLLKTQSDELKQILKNGTVDIITDEKNSSDKIQNLLFGFALLGSGEALSLDGFVMLDEIFKSDPNYSKYISQFLINLPTYKGLVPAKLKTIQNNFIKKIEAAVLDDDPNDPQQLYNIVKAELHALKFIKIENYKSGDEIIRSYDDKQKRPNKKDRDEYLARYIAGSSGFYYFQYKDSIKEYEDIYQTILKYLSKGSTRIAKRKQVKSSVTSFDSTNTFFITSPFVDAFLNGEPLDEDTRTALSRDPMEVRSAFMIHYMDSMLLQSNGYNTLSFQQKFEFYRFFIDQQNNHLGYRDEERVIKNQIYSILISAATSSDLQLLQGQYTLDEAMNIIFDASKRFAEFNWVGSTDASTRPIHKHDPNMFRRISQSLWQKTERVVKNLPRIDDDSSNIGLIFSGNNFYLTYQRFNPINLSPIIGGFSQAMDYIKKKFSFNTRYSPPSSNNSSPSLEGAIATPKASKPVSEEKNKEQPSPIYFLNTYAHNMTPSRPTPLRVEEVTTVTPTIPFITPPPSSEKVTAKKPATKTSAKASAKADIQPKPKPQQKKKEKEKEMVKEKQKEKTETVPELKLPDYQHGRLKGPLNEAEAILGDKRLPLANLKQVPTTAKKDEGLISKTGTRILDYIFPPAHGFVPIVVLGVATAPEAVAIGSVAAIAVADAIHSRLGPNSITNRLMEIREEKNNGYTFPISKNDQSHYDGGNLEEAGLDPYTFPASREDREATKTRTLVNQPGNSGNIYSFPKSLLFHPRDSIYLRKKEDVTVKQLTFSEGPRRFYQHDYPKHQANPKTGLAKWGGKASINPIPNEKVGQSLLDNAYYDSSQKNQLFAYHDGKVIKFRHSRDNYWHSYEVKEQIKRDIGSPILKLFLDDRLITKAEYNRLLKK